MRPNRAILLAMARAEKPLNRYELEHDYTKLSKQTIYDWIRRMEALGWIIQKTETRCGRPVKFYEPTDLGLYRSAKYASDPDTGDLRLAERIRERLGNKYESFENNAMLGRRQQVEPLTKMISEVLLSQKALPGWSLRLQINADQNGGVRSWVEWGPPIRRKKSRRRHFRFNSIDRRKN